MMFSPQQLPYPLTSGFLLDLRSLMLAKPREASEGSRNALFGVRFLGECEGDVRFYTILENTQEI